jgi:manganese oxidase
VYRKALLKQYPFENDECQWDQSPINSKKQNGLLGPTIRAVVGDTILVHFYNNAETLYTFENSNPNDDDFSKHLTFNLIPHGLQYQGTTPISYLEETVYTWTAVESSGPGEGTQFSSNLWMYTSQVNAVYDLNSGIIGAIVIVDPRYVVTSFQRDLGVPCDIDDESFLLMGTFSEAHSWYDLFSRSDTDPPQH